jgi:arylsulfatase A-like enzyme
MRKRLAVLFALAALTPARAGPSAGKPAPHAIKPKLAVIIAVDGLSWDRLSSWRPWFTSGLARLLDEGAVSSKCHYGHLNTVTAPGHASLATGAPPRVHGIAHNDWYLSSPDGKTMATIYSASQPATGEPESSARTIPGAGRLRVPTLADRMTASDPRMKVVTLSDKDRAAILLAGRDARHIVYWYSEKTGTFGSSAAYDAKSPDGAAAAAVVARFNAEEGGEHLAARFGTTWSRLPVPAKPPAQGFESGLDAFQEQVIGPSFPHDLTRWKQALPSALLWTPVADRLITDLALDLLADDALALGRDDVPDLLGLSFSANDYVSHSYGPESVEDLEILRALDLSIGRLLDDLTARFGKDGVLVALSADHGFFPLPEATKRSDPSAVATRVAAPAIMDQLNAAVNAAFKRTGGPPLVYRLEGCSLWLNRAALAAPGAPDANAVLAIVERELAGRWKDAIFRTFAVDGAFPSRHEDEVGERAWNARVPGRSGDLFVVPRYGVFIDGEAGKGTSHGTPWEYDTHVPLIFWGGGVKPHTLSSPTTPYDLAPTMASWLGVSLPDATGHRLDLSK